MATTASNPISTISLCNIILVVDETYTTPINVYCKSLNMFVHNSGLPPHWSTAIFIFHIHRIIFSRGCFPLWPSSSFHVLNFCSLQHSCFSLLLFFFFLLFLLSSLSSFLATCCTMFKTCRLVFP